MLEGMRRHRKAQPRDSSPGESSTVMEWGSGTADTFAKPSSSGTGV